jgi:DNA-binding FadR family transcriptional regulator
VPELKLTRLVVPKSSDVLADALRRQILDGTLAPGASLPAERDLVTRAGLSRGSVREALRILEAEGLLRTRPGRLGGSVVVQPDDGMLAKYVSLFVQGRRVRLESLLQAREAIEPTLAALAARNRSAEELALLVAATERVESSFADVDRFLHDNVGWHVAIATAGHNELMRAFLVSIAGLIHRASAIPEFANEEVRAVVLKAHRRVLAAIVARDEDAARRRMARHMAALSDWVKVLPRVPETLPAD